MEMSEQVLPSDLNYGHPPVFFSLLKKKRKRKEKKKILFIFDFGSSRNFGGIAPLKRITNEFGDHWFEWRFR